MLSNLSFSSSYVIGIAVGLVAVLLGFIAMMRYYTHHQDKAILKEKNQRRPPTFSVTGRSKYPEADVFQYHHTLLWLGLVFALSIMVVAMNWTLTEQKIIIPADALVMDEEVMVNIPRSASPPPPPPPPPPPIIEEVPDNLIAELDNVDFTDQSADANLNIMPSEPAPLKTNQPVPPPPPPPPSPEPAAAEIFKVVEEMPRFPGCEDLASKEEKIACSQEKLLAFVYANIKYPAIARDNNLQGTAVIRFVISAEGMVQDAEIVRDIGGGCGDEALRVVNLMRSMPSPWIPGKQRGRAVPVYFNLPVKFILKDSAP